MIINDTEILHKIIELQSCIIEGRSVKAILHKNIDFFLDHSKADFITIYIHEHGMVKPEYILEKGKLLTHLIKKYIFDKKNFKWYKFVANCDKHFASGLKHAKITELFEIFRGFINKREATSFTEELQMESAIMMPILDVKGKDIVGYICFLFQSDKDIDIEKLQTVKQTIEKILLPLYDKKVNTLYKKCIRVDDEMHFLTDQEKKIVKKVLTGAPYSDIADTFNISINTLKTHMKNIFNKSNVSSKIELFNKFHMHR